MKKCRYCEKEAVKRYSPDLDIEWVYLCANKECFIKYYLNITQWISKITSI
jgi:hypothetical protein